MANKATRFKSVVVKEIPRTSLAEAGINKLTLPDGSRVVSIANALWPHHDRNLHQMILRYIAAFKPKLVVLQGQIIDHEAFKSLTEDEKNYLHPAIDSPEVAEARKAGIFDDQLGYLRKKAGEFVASFAASGAKVVYIPGVRTEHKLMEWVQQEKETRDAYVANNPERSDEPTDPNRKVPTDFAKFLYLNQNPRVKVLGYEAGLLVNEHTLFMIGDFKRRHPGDAAFIEWEQRGYNIVRSFGGMLSSGWHTTTKHTQPALTKLQHQEHETGYIWDDLLNGHLRDYDRRAPGFFSGEYRLGELFGECVQIIRGNDDRRSFLGADFKIYSEDEPGGLDNGGVISLDDEEVSPDDDWHYPEDGDEGEGNVGGNADTAATDAQPAVVAEIVADAPKAPAKPRVRKPATKAGASKKATTTASKAKGKTATKTPRKR
jgi:hypothetical protein